MVFSHCFQTIILSIALLLVNISLRRSNNQVDAINEFKVCAIITKNNNLGLQISRILLSFYSLFTYFSNICIASAIIIIVDVVVEIIIIRLCKVIPFRMIMFPHSHLSILKKAIYLNRLLGVILMAYPT